MTLRWNQLLIALGLCLGMLTNGRAKPPDLPRQTEIHCDKPADLPRSLEVNCDELPGQKSQDKIRIGGAVLAVPYDPVEKSDTTAPTVKMTHIDEIASDLYQQGEYEMHEGRIERACEYYEEVLKLSPKSRYAELSKDRLTNLEDLRGSCIQVEVVKEETLGSEEASSEPAGVKKKTEEQIIIAAYDVTPLLCEWTVEWDRKADLLRVVKKDATKAKVKEILHRIEDGIGPETLSKRGGAGSLEYGQPTGALVVRHCWRIHDQIQGVLQTLYREQTIRKQNCQQQVKNSQQKRRVRTISLKQAIGLCTGDETCPFVQADFVVTSEGKTFDRPAKDE